jgi:hypothetical protein
MIFRIVCLVYTTFTVSRQLLNDIGFSWELPSKRRKKRDELLDLYNDGDSSSSTSKSSSSLSSSELLNESWREKWPIAMNEAEVVKPLSAMEIFEATSKLNIARRPIQEFDPARMFEPIAFREVSAEAVREYMQVSYSLLFIIISLIIYVLFVYLFIYLFDV